MGGSLSMHTFFFRWVLEKAASPFSTLHFAHNRVSSWPPTDWAIPPEGEGTTTVDDRSAAASATAAASASLPHSITNL